jgi:hypothetical protein
MVAGWVFYYFSKGETMPTNPQLALAAWKAGMGTAGARMTAGVNAVTVSPTAQAAAAVNKWQQGVQRAAQNGSFVNGCNSVSLQDWKTATIQKGVPNMQNGVNALTPKAQQNMAAQVAFSQQLSQTIQSMPNTTESEAEARALAAIRGMRAYGRKSGS